MNRKLLRGEQLISTWQDLTLTTYSLWQRPREGTTAAFTAIPIDAVQWMKLGRHHLPWLLWLAVVTGVLGIVALEHDRNITYGLFGVALLLVLLYGTSRKIVLEIGAGTGRVVVQVLGETGNFDAALKFLHDVELRRLAHHATGEGRSAAGSGTWQSPPGP